MKINIFNKKTPRTSEFSRFFREASSGERKKVFMRVLRKASNDQLKVLNRKTAK